MSEEENYEYYLIFNERNEDRFIELTGDGINTDDVYRASRLSDGTIKIQDINALEMNKKSLHEYAKMVAQRGEFLVIDVDEEFADQYEASEVLILRDLGESKYKLVEGTRKEYYLLDRHLRYYIDKKSYKLVMVTRRKGKQGYSIVNYPDTLEIKMNADEYRMQHTDTNFGIFISISDKNVKEDVKDLITTCRILEDGSYEISEGHKFLLPPSIPKNLQIVDKVEYLKLMKKSEPVVIKNYKDGSFRIEHASVQKSLKGLPIYYMASDIDIEQLTSETSSETLLAAYQRVDFSSTGYNKPIKQKVK